MSNGVIKKLTGEKSYYTCKDVQELLGVSKSKAYQMISIMREECITKGIISSVYPHGKIPKRYFDQMCLIA